MAPAAPFEIFNGGINNFNGGINSFQEQEELDINW